MGMTSFIPGTAQPVPETDPVALAQKGAANGLASLDGNSLVAQAAKILRESGGQDLPIGAVADGQILQRSGANLVGAPAAGGDYTRLATFDISSPIDTTPVTIASGLNGDADGIYVLFGNFIGDNIFHSLRFVPNGVPTGVEFHDAVRQTGTAIAGVGLNDFRMGQTGDVVGSDCWFKFIIYASRNGVAGRRQFFSEFNQIRTGPQLVIHRGAGVWADVSTNITSIAVSSSSANVTGGRISVYKITP